MATGTSGSTTTNFDLILPGYEDDTDVDDLNENFKTIDGELYDATQAIAQNASAIQTVQDSLGHVTPVRNASISFGVLSNGTAAFIDVDDGQGNLYTLWFTPGNIRAEKA